MSEKTSPPPAGPTGIPRPPDWTENFIADVEVVVREAAPLASQDAVVGILSGILRHGDTEGRPLLHALEDEVDAIDIRRNQG